MVAIVVAVAVAVAVAAAVVVALPFTAAWALPLRSCKALLALRAPKQK